MTGAALVLLASFPVVVAGGQVDPEVEGQLEALSARIEEERAALAGLAEQRTELLAILSGLERLALDSEGRVRALERNVKQTQARIDAAEKARALAAEALGRQHAALAPRLKVLYRVLRKDRLAFLLSASDIGAALKRARMLKGLVSHDVWLLREAQRLEGFHGRLSRRLARMKRSAQLRAHVLHEETTLAKMRRELFESILAQLKLDERRSVSALAELEHADRELTAMVAGLGGGATSGFASQRGRLPYPTEGIVEVGFGRIVNPKFNTVTAQKGLDIRASEGTPVLAIASGSVVFAGWLKGYGNLVIIDHGDGFHTLMAHLARLDVGKGTRLEPGAQVGAVGETGSLKGPYLYFEIRHKGEAIDPAPWLAEPR